VTKKINQKKKKKKMSDETRWKPGWKLNDLISEIEFEKVIEKGKLTGSVPAGPFHQTKRLSKSWWLFLLLRLRIYFTLLVPSSLYSTILNAGGNVYHRLFVERQIQFFVCDPLN
jgi:hypothetical protein